MKNLTKFFGLALLAVASFSCSDDDNNDNNNQQTIAEIAAGNPQFSTLVTALNRTGLTSVLNGTVQYTVFAPTNDAFNTFFSSLGSNVNVNNVDANILKNILLNHVIESEIKSTDIPASTYVTTLSPINTNANAPRVSMFVQKSGSTVTLNGGINNKGAVVSTADVDASNGVIHIVNRVIQIPTIVDHAKGNPNFSTLVSLLVNQNLAGTLDGTSGSPFTVFAPLNSAFDNTTLALYNSLSDANKTNVLLYHVVGNANVRSNAIPSGAIQTLLTGQTFSITGTSINDAGSEVNKNIVLTDVQGSNGIVHAIDKVLLPSL